MHQEKKQGWPPTVAYFRPSDGSDSKQRQQFIFWALACPTPCRGSRIQTSRLANSAGCLSLGLTISLPSPRSQPGWRLLSHDSGTKDQ